MNSSAILALPATLSDRQKTALLKLLGDDDPAVFRPVRNTIIARGREAAGWIRAERLSDDPVLRRRTQEIIRYFDRQEADNAFLGFCLNNGQEFDLETAAWLLAKTRYPEINVAGYQALLDHFADELAIRLGTSSKIRERLLTINTYLFETLQFTGNEENYYDPDNSYLNRVIDRRTGNPISLCLLYILLGRRLHLPVSGIGLPGHFVCRYQSSSVECYIDTFNHGKLLTKADCIQYLQQANYSLRDDYLAPVTPRRMFLRICGNLHQVYVHLDQDQEATRLQRYVVALAK